MPTETSDTFADGIATRSPDPEALAVIRRGADRIIQVAEDEIREAMRWYFSDTHQVAEGAGAAPLAALARERARVAGRTVGVVLSGGNIDRELYAGVLGSG